MNILDNELVRKYFGCEAPLDCTLTEKDHRLDIASDILTAMQEPIRKGERYLWCGGDGNILEEIAGTHGLEMSDPSGFHPHCLRLPDRFQKREYEMCHRCGEPLDKLGVKDYKWDKNGGVYSCIHTFKTAPEPLRDIAVESEAGRPEPEKCGCAYQIGHTPECASRGFRPKPFSAVEDARFRTTNALWNGPKKTHNEIDVLVRALVKLARETK